MTDTTACGYCGSTAGYYTQTDVTPHRVRCYGCYSDRPPAAPVAKDPPTPTSTRPRETDDAARPDADSAQRRAATERRRP